MGKKDRSEPEDFERNRRRLDGLLTDPENSVCFDCNSHGPRWASASHGIFLCLRCSGIHRNLGVHISKVKSVNLDKWTSAQVKRMEDVGNRRGRRLYEAETSRKVKKPDEHTDDRTMESYIRLKYEQRAFFSKDAGEELDTFNDWNSPTSPTKKKKKSHRDDEHRQAKDDVKRDRAGQHKDRKKSEDGDDDNDGSAKRASSLSKTKGAITTPPSSGSAMDALTAVSVVPPFTPGAKIRFRSLQVRAEFLDFAAPRV
eukprot:NODE_3097_length_1050_cov_28.292707_g2844_i0.p1 GENE.NODE_3097_length_1050_cov_28.292707_g2844_i0~~NODE_3097_length_1050_cov_28.292707_g2844_i0.p1  ORF type:complete len:282 (+),score=44.54 NODE_3097_length_1050_cov_28.292707_g2844_i0:81-848(+)